MLQLTVFIAKSSKIEFASQEERNKHKNCAYAAWKASKLSHYEGKEQQEGAEGRVRIGEKG